MAISTGLKIKSEKEKWALGKGALCNFFITEEVEFLWRVTDGTREQLLFWRP